MTKRGPTSNSERSATMSAQLAKILATQKLYQGLTGTKHVHLKGRRVSRLARER